MRITDAITQTGAAKQVQKATGVKSEAKESQKTKNSDSVSISKAALEASEGQKVETRVNALPDVREERVAEVKSRVESGYYNTSEFQDKLADKLLNEFGIKQ